MVEQIRVNDSLQPWHNGKVLSPPYLTDSMNIPHGDAREGQVVSILVDTAANSTIYSYLVEGEEISYESSDAADEEEIAEGLADAHNKNPLARGLFLAEAIESDAGVSGIDTVQLTALQIMEGFDVETDDSNLDLSEDTSHDEGEAFPVARAVYIVDGRATLSKPTGDIEDVLAGVTAYRYDEEVEDARLGGDIEIPVNQDIVYVRRGVVGLSSAPDAARRGTVYVGTTDNAELGMFFDEAGTGRTEIPLAAAEWDGPNRLMLKLA